MKPGRLLLAAVVALLAGCEDERRYDLVCEGTFRSGDQTIASSRHYLIDLKTRTWCVASHLCRLGPDQPFARIAPDRLVLMETPQPVAVDLRTGAWTAELGATGKCVKARYSGSTLPAPPAWVGSGWPRLKGGWRR